MKTREPSSHTTSLGHGWILVKYVPATGRAYYYVAKFDGSKISRTFTNKRNALKLARHNELRP